jgi:RNase P subunit RPR2
MFCVECILLFYLQKKGITQKKADIEFIITNRVNRLFKQAIQRFKEDVKLWMSYIKFCKQMVSVRYRWRLET